MKSILATVGAVAILLAILFIYVADRDPDTKQDEGDNVLRPDAP